jgi:4-oxalocrotonate tautomerase
MPHVIVKLWPGKTESQKHQLAEALTRDVMRILHYGGVSVSVAMEEIEPSDWLEHVYRPDIEAKPQTLYKRPGYSEADLS